MNSWYVYLLACDNDMLYCGSTNDVARRYAQHCAGKGAKFTKINPPLKLLGYRSFATRSAACQAEYRVKQLSKAKKLQWLDAKAPC
jgi:putative endonuclease